MSACEGVRVFRDLRFLYLPTPGRQSVSNLYGETKTVSGPEFLKAGAELRGDASKRNFHRPFSAQVERKKDQGFLNGHWFSRLDVSGFTNPESSMNQLLNKKSAHRP
jgi:hypothetical protein